VAFGAIDPRPELALAEGAEFCFQPPQERIKDYYARCDAWLFGAEARVSGSAAGGDGLPNPVIRNASRRRSGLSPGRWYPGSG